MNVTLTADDLEKNAWARALLDESSSARADDGSVTVSRDLFIKHFNKHLAAPSSHTHGDGVGSQVKKIITKLGLGRPNCSNCNRIIQAMDSRGISWCVQNRSAIIAKLQDRFDGLKDTEVIAAVLRGMAKPTLWFIDPDNIVVSIVEEGIRLAREAELKRGGVPTAAAPTEKSACAPAALPPSPAE